MHRPPAKRASHSPLVRGRPQGAELRGFKHGPVCSSLHPARECPLRATHPLREAVPVARHRGRRCHRQGLRIRPSPVSVPGTGGTRPVALLVNRPCAWSVSVLFATTFWSFVGEYSSPAVAAADVGVSCRSHSHGSLSARWWDHEFPDSHEALHTGTTEPTHPFS